MDDARRFLRYVSPGIVFAVECSLLLWIVLPGWFVAQVGALKTDQGLGLAVVFFLASGGFGFLIGTIHHALNWRDWDEVLDHRPWIVRLSESGTLQLKESVGGPILNTEQIAALSRARAWAVLTTLWHEREHLPSLHHTTRRTTVLNDVTHSLGSLRVISVLAPVAASIIALNVGHISWARGDVVRFLVAAVIAFALAWVQHAGYRRTGLMARNVIEQALTDTLVLEANGGHVVAHIPPRGSKDPAA